MISRRAVTEYLARPAENFDWMKQLSSDELDEMIADIKPRPNIKVPFNNAQKICFILGVLFPGFVFHLDMGVGKTSLTLELLKWYYDTGIIGNTLVLAPTDEIVLGWEDEIRFWGIDLPYRLMLGDGRKKGAILESLDKGLAITSYMGWSTMVSQKERKTKIVRGEEREEVKYNTQKDLLKLMTEWFDSLVLDETTRGPSNRQTLIFKAVKPISMNSKVRFGLVGRLFGKNPMPVWGQFYLIDHGDSFGTTLGMFREAFFKSTKGYFGGTDYKFRKDREPELYKFIGNRSIYFGIDEVADLPEITRPPPKTCVFPDDTETYYQRCVDEIISHRSNFRELKNTFLRMRQISSGFVGVVDDEENEKAVIEFPDNPKLDLLMELIEEVPQDRKAVIYHEFNWSGARICHELRRAKIKHGWLYGGTKDWENIKRQFNESPDFRFLVINWKKGGYGLNLQAANYGFFFESPTSIIDREQCERRLRRQRQRWAVVIIDLVMRGSVDQKILNSHQDGRDLWDEVMKNPSILKEAA
jgi:hypothetical protein